MQTQRILTSLSLLAIFAAAIPAQTTISPTDRRDYDGSSSTSFPLGRHNARVQTLHDDLGTQLTTIFGHSYRRDAVSTRGSIEGFSTELSIELSISPRSADQPSRNFVDNQGAQPTLVLPRTRLVFPRTERPLAAPAAGFELIIPYATPFIMPAGGGTLCLDVTIYGNSTSQGENRNFSPLIDAHEQFSDGHAEQPGFRFGEGCPAPGSSTRHSGRFTMIKKLDGFDLEIASRSGIPGDGSGAMVTVAIFGPTASPFPWPLQPDCILMVSPSQTFMLPEANDARGHVDSVISAPSNLPPDFVTTAQLASAVLNGALTFSDVSIISVPPLGPMTIQASRIANSNDGTAATGSTSFSVPVTRFF